MRIRWRFWPIFYKGNLKKLVYIVKVFCRVCGGQGNPQGQRAELSIFLQALYFISSCKVPPSPPPLPSLFSFLLSAYIILFPFTTTSEHSSYKFDIWLNKVCWSCELNHAWLFSEKETDHFIALPPHKGQGPTFFLPGRKWKPLGWSSPPHQGDPRDLLLSFWPGLCPIHQLLHTTCWA